MWSPEILSKQNYVYLLITNEPLFRVINSTADLECFQFWITQGDRKLWKQACTTKNKYIFLLHFVYFILLLVLLSFLL